MTPPQFSRPRGTRRRAAFSLVLSLTVMAMLLVLCLGAAALLTVELRVSRATSSYAKARLNAMAGVRIALGELQRLAGPDRRITANAAIIDRGGKPDGAAGIGRPRTLGVWKGLSSASGNPATWSATNLPAVAPVSGSYDTDHDAAFAGWLSSGSVGEGTGGVPLTQSGGAVATGLAWMKGGTSAPKPDRDWLLLSGGAAYAGDASFKNDDPRDLYATPENFTDAAGNISGQFAWTVMDENQKARVDLRDSTSPLSPEERAVLLAASARRFHPAYEADNKTADKWSSQITPPATNGMGGWNIAALEGRDTGWFPLEPKSSFTPAKALRHDFTTDSVTLLTDTANGGLKRDINTLPLMPDTNFDALPTVGGVKGYIGFEATSNKTPDGRSAWWRSAKTNNIRYAGTGNPTGTDNGGNPLTDPMPKIWPVWSDVREWARFATTATVSAGGPLMKLNGGIPSIPMISSADYAKFIGDTQSNKPVHQYHSAWRQPVLQRYRWEISIYAQPDTAPATTYRLLPKINVIAQIWNPYNVMMTLDGSVLNSSMWSLPFVIRLTGKNASGAPLTKNMDFAYWSGGQQSLVSNTLALSGSPLKPGEIRTYSITGNSTTLQTGYTPSGGMKFAANYVSDTTGFSATDPVTATIVLRGSDTNFKSLLDLHAPNAISAAHNNLFSNPRDKADSNPTRIFGNNTAAGLGTPLSLVVNPSQRVAIFDIHRKTEAKGGSGQYTTAYPNAATPVTYGESQRFHFGEPTGLWGRFLMADGKIPTWYAAPVECLVWSTGLNDPENTNDLQVEGASLETGYGGTGQSASTGMDSFVYYRLPTHPPVGLFSLRHARLGGGLRPLLDFKHSGDGNYDSGVDSDPRLYTPHNAFGNSLINPYIPTDSATGPANNQPNTWQYNGRPDGYYAFTPYDMSWIMNAAVADSWFCSSLGDWNRGVAASLFPSVKKDAATLFTDFTAGKKRLPDERFAPEPLTAKEPADLLSSDGATDDAYQKVAAHMLLEGGFNINSTSVRAWRAFLAASHADSGAENKATGVLVANATSRALVDKQPETATFPVDDTPGEKPTASPAPDAAGRVNGGRVLSDPQLDKLAYAMVEQVKKRGPFLTVGEFLNRRLEQGELGQMGAVQSAIETVGLNDHLKTTGYAQTSPGAGVSPNTDLEKVYHHSGVNQPGWFSQADLLAPVGNALSARGDTFVIRVSATTNDGSDTRVTMELTVRRSYQFVDTSDKESVELNNLKSGANKAFGRRFVVASAKWLTNEEI